MQNQATPDPRGTYVGFCGDDVDPSEGAHVHDLEDDWPSGSIPGTRIDPATGRVFYSARWL